MNRIVSILCILLILLTIPAILHAAKLLPLSTHTLIEKKYDGWSGVLRIWVYEGWKNGSGTLSGWLNRSIASFEKAHNGIYVQAKYVDANALTNLYQNGIRPPDMILFPPGVLRSAEALIELDGALPVRAPLKQSGSIGDRLYAAPVALGGYAWACNTALVPQLPNDWQELAVSALPDEPHRAWSAALLALCSGSYSDREEAAPLQLPGMDFGLTIDETPAPSATPEPVGEMLPCRLAQDFAFSERAYTQFTQGKLAAIPVTQWELSRLEALSDKGKGCDWMLADAGVYAFTDQILYLGIVRGDDESILDRQILSSAFLQHLLSEACQGKLNTCGAFSVTKDVSGYASYEKELVIESALRKDTLRVPNAFSTNWRGALDARFDSFISGSLTAKQCLDQIFP